MPGQSSTSPPDNRANLEAEDVSQHQDVDEHNEDTENNCSICLQPMEDRTVVPTCSHEFCFDCLMIWTAQSRRCPLCTQTIGDYIIHDIRSRLDYRKHHLALLREKSPRFLLPAQTTASIEARNAARRRRIQRDYERRQREGLSEDDKLELSVATRRWIYKHDLYAKHVASNSYTKYRPYPTPAQFASSPDLISRTTTFLRRELQVWQGLDVEFLTNVTISLMKSIDIRSESAVKLLAEFLDMDAPYQPGNRHVNAEHFAHEVYSYVRSPYRDLFVYDSVVQYDRPADISPPPHKRRRHARWREPSQESPESNGHRGSRSPSGSPRQRDHGVSHSLARQLELGNQQAPLNAAGPGPAPDSPGSRPRESAVRSCSNSQRNVEIGRHHDHNYESPTNDMFVHSATGVSKKGKEKDVCSS